MAYSFDQRDINLQAAVQRIADDQASRARVEIDHAELPLADRVHQVRKRTKKLRGLLRLVRPGTPHYSEENRTLRDLARQLSDMRDQAALIETYDRLMERYADEVDRPSFAPLRRELTLDRQANEVRTGLDSQLDQLKLALGDIRVRARTWQIETSEVKALKGLKKTYKRAIQAMEDARDHNARWDLMHGWRKRVKYHGYHARLLAKTFPAVAAHSEAAERLGSLLGDHHDLAVFEQRAASGPLSKPNWEQLQGLIHRRARELADQAFTLGPRVFAESPSAVWSRWTVYWNARPIDPGQPDGCLP